MILYTIVTLVQPDAQPDAQLLKLITSFLCFHPVLGATMVQSNILEMFLINQQCTKWSEQHWPEDPVQDLLDGITLCPERERTSISTCYEGS